MSLRMLPGNRRETIQIPRGHKFTNLSFMSSARLIYTSNCRFVGSTGEANFNNIVYKKIFDVSAAAR